MSPIVGNRYNLRGHDWDLCEAEFAKLTPAEQQLYVKIPPPSIKSFPPPNKEGFHPGVSCDRSGMCPIVGIRYNLRGHNYDLCQAEYDKLPEPEKRYYQKIPPRCSGVRVPPPCNPMRHCGPPRGHCPMGPGPMANPMGGGPMGGTKLAARFVCDVSIFDGTQMAPATKFTKIWRIKNIGDIPWPPGSKLLFVGGDQMTAALAVPVSAGGPVGPGVDTDVAVDMVAPADIGRYVSYWRLTGPHGRRKFGQRIWCHVQVVEPDAAVAPPSEADLAEMRAKQKQLIGDDEADEEDAPLADDKGGADVGTAPAAAGALTPVEVASNEAPGTSKGGEDGESNADSYCEIEADDAEEQTAEAGKEAEGAHDAAEEVAAELAAMGFTDGETVRFVIDRNGAQLEACARDLASLSEWEALVDDLVEMGFSDRVRNKRALIKNHGSIKGAVKDLVTDAV
jgi:next-to-BRCA1 protein 1